MKQRQDGPAQLFWVATGDGDSRPFYADSGPVAAERVVPPSRDQIEPMLFQTRLLCGGRVWRAARGSFTNRALAQTVLSSHPTDGARAWDRGEMDVRLAVSD